MSSHLKHLELSSDIMKRQKKFVGGGFLCVCVFFLVLFCVFGFGFFSGLVNPQ